jgi:glycine dehydrogenase subunit 1
MPYIPHTEADRQAMLATIGVSSIEDLFREIPHELRIEPGALNLPPALDEAKLSSHLLEISKKNVNLADVVSFLGAGVYDRFVPATVNTVISRGEYLTAYTPYQPEASQGYLQTIYEFQTMIAELYGCDLANASMYDGPTSMAEAAIMAVAATGRGKVAVSEAIHPHYRQVLDTYCWALGLEVSVIPTEMGLTRDYASLSDEFACVIVGYPNFFGEIEDLATARAASERAGALLIVVADPVACALLKPPGEFGADVVVGEGQPLGISMGFGGPMLGLFACKQEHVRRIPGRIVGRTQEMHGDKVGYVMTLRTREQDIRREKATSNICTNEALMALAATVYMTAMGKNGMKQVAESTVRNTQYAIAELGAIGVGRRFSGKVFGEFVVDLPVQAETVRDALLEKNILAGLPLGPYYRGMENCLLLAVTEMRTKEQIDALVREITFVIRKPRNRPVNTDVITGNV